MNKFFSVFIKAAMSFLIVLQTTPCRAAGIDSKDTYSSLNQKDPQQTAEYMFRNTPRDNLIAVQLFGSVDKPGLYYVPEDTDLMKLLILSGGVKNEGELEEIYVRKADTKSWFGLDMKFIKQTGPQTYRVNVDNMLKEAPTFRPLKLAHQDFVYVPEKTPLISNDTSRVITVGAVVLSAILTVLLINEHNK